MNLMQRILHELRAEPLTVRELVWRTAFDPGSCRHALRRLRARGCVERIAWARYAAVAGAPSPPDRRGRPRNNASGELTRRRP